MKKSAQIDSYLVENGYPQQAKSYRIFNFDLAKTKVSGPGELTFDTKQNSWVLSDRDVEKIKEFQSTKNIKADGKVNWLTMKYLGKVERPSGFCPIQ